MIKTPDAADPECTPGKLGRAGHLAPAYNQEGERFVRTDHCLPLALPAPNKVEQRLDGDIGHIALTREQGRNRQWRLFNADEFYVDVFSPEITEFQCQFHHRVRNERRHRVSDHKPEWLGTRACS